MSRLPKANRIIPQILTGWNLSMGPPNWKEFFSFYLSSSMLILNVPSVWCVRWASVNTVVWMWSINSKSVKDLEGSLTLAVIALISQTHKNQTSKWTHVSIKMWLMCSDTAKSGKTLKMQQSSTFQGYSQFFLRFFGATSDFSGLNKQVYLCKKSQKTIFKLTFKSKMIRCALLCYSCDAIIINGNLWAKCFLPSVFCWPSAVVFTSECDNPRYHLSGGLHCQMHTMWLAAVIVKIKSRFSAPFFMT